MKKLLLFACAVALAVAPLSAQQIRRTANGLDIQSGPANPTTLTGNFDLSNATFTAGNFSLSNGSVVLGSNTATVNGIVANITANIDATSAANTTIYTPPNGTVFTLTNIQIVAANVSSLSGAPVLHFMAGATTANLTANVTLTSLANGTYFNVTPLTTVLTNCNSTVPLTLNISTGATASNCTIRVLFSGRQR